MWYNYLKVAVRNLIRNRFYAIINVIGLSVGISCSLLIFLFLQFEFSYDKFYPHHERIYRVANTFITELKKREIAAADPNIALHLQDEFSEDIEALTKVLPTEGCIINNGERNQYYYDIYFADASYFDVFQHSFLEGYADFALQDSSSIVLTHSLAKELFGDIDVLGKQLKVNSTKGFKFEKILTVTAVIEDLPQNTHLPFQALISWLPENRIVSVSWVYTYLLEREGHSIQNLENNWDHFYNKYLADKYKNQNAVTIQPIFQTLENIYLNSNLELELRNNANINYLYVFLTLAVFIITIACINYVNMATVQSYKRKREVGMRKVLGASSESIMRQFLVESLFVTTIAFIIGLAITENVLPFYNKSIGKTLTINLLNNYYLFIGLEIIFIFVILLSGFYPAFHLSAQEPVQALRGHLLKIKNGIRLRKALVVTQFLITIITLAGTGVVYQQLIFLKNKELGFQYDNIIVARLPQDNTTSLYYPSIKATLLQNPYILKISRSTEIPGDKFLPQYIFEVKKGSDYKEEVLGRMSVDRDFFDLLGMQLIQGDRFSDSSYTENHIIVNETAVNKLQWKEPLGKTIARRDANGNRIEATVIGVIRDFHFNSLHTKIAPIVFFLNDKAGNMYLEIDPEGRKEALSYLKQVWQAFNKNANTNKPITYFNLKDNFKSQYQEEENLGDLLTYFSIVTVIISCMGLLGLSSYTIHLKTKEIGIRKVLGASVFVLVRLIIKSYLKLMLLAILLSIPLLYLMTEKWLSTFAYQAEIHWSVFLMAILISFIAAVLPLFIQSIKAAYTSPVDSIKSE